MTYRSKPQFRSWNAAALSLKQEEHEEPISKDRQRPRRESWSQPPQRGRGMRGRGVWYIDNRPGRPQYRRRYTMPNPGDNCQDFSCHSNDGSSDYNQPEDNPIMEEPRNLSSPENDSNDFKTKENDEEKYYHQEETPSWNRKFSADNIYRPPKSRSWRSNSSSDDGSQSQSYSDGSSNKYEPENYKAQRNNSWEREPISNGSNHVWVHGKYSGSESEQKDKKDASTQVSPLDINNELKNANTAKTKKEIITNKLESPRDHKPELSNEIADKPESPKDNRIGFPKEITIKFSELTKESDEKPESIIQDSKSELLIEPKVVSETKSEGVIPDVVPSTSPEDDELTTPALINFDGGDNTRSKEAAPAEVAPEVASEVASGITPEVAPDKSSEVTPASPKEEELTIPMLINLDEDDNTGAQPIQPKISEDILALDWGSYQKTLIEEEIRRTMERPTKSAPHKLDKGLKDFDSLL